MLSRAREENRRWPSQRLFSILALLALPAFRAGAQEIAPFVMTGVEGNVNMSFVSDEMRTGQPGNSSRTAQSGLRTELFVMTHSYVYHPNFLSLDIGGGPVFLGQQFSNDGSQTASQGTLYNFSARANLFRGRPLSASFYFEHLNPTLTVAPGEVMTQESTRQGFDLNTTSAFSPIPVRVSYSKSEVVGRGTTRSINEQVEQFSLGASQSWGSLGSTQFQFQQTRQDSLSGSLKLPVQASHSDSQGFNLDTRLQFGSEVRHDFTNLLVLNNRQYELGVSTQPDQRDFNLLFDLRSRFSEQLNTYLLANYSGNDQGVLHSTTRVLGSGFNYLPDKVWRGSLGIRTEENASTFINIRSNALDGSLKYQKEMFSGVFDAGYSFRLDHRSQVALGASADVLGESVMLSGFLASTLSRPLVIPGSVVVMNASRTQRFVENIDYRLVPLGTQMQILRLIGGSILDGEMVLVDYAYNPGGSYSQNQLDQTLNLNWGVSRYFNAYLREYVSRPHIVSGTATVPLNEIRSTIVGSRGEFPLGGAIPFVLGGSLEQEIRDETISPYRRRSLELYLQSNDEFLGLGNSRLATRRVRTIYQNSLQDVDLTAYDFRAWTKRWLGIDLSLSTVYEKDDGGILPRRRLDNVFSAQWRERKLTSTLSLSTTRERQGDFQRDRWLLNWTLRRDF